MSKREIILTTEDDWDLWIEKIEAITPKSLWPHIEPSYEVMPPGIKELLDEPECLTVGDFNPRVASYAALTAPQQRLYENARKFYDQDLKRYQRQEDQMQTIRKYIMDTISEKKQRLLKPEDDTYDWLIKLRECTEPDTSMMIAKIHNKYTESLKGLK